MTGVEFIQTWFRRVWIEADPAAIEEMFAPSAQANGVMEMPLGAVDFEALVPAFQALVEQIDVTVTQLVEADPWVAAVVRVRGHCPMNDGAVDFTGQMLLRIEDGVCVEAFNHFDFVTLFEQIGALPPNTVALGLSGETI